MCTRSEHTTSHRRIVAPPGKMERHGGHGPLAGMADECVPTKQLRKRNGENKKEGRQQRDAWTGLLRSSWAWNTVDERNRSWTGAPYRRR